MTAPANANAQRPLHDTKAKLSEKRLFPASDVYTVLKKIPDPGLAILGLPEEYAQPDWMTLTILPVPLRLLVRV